MLYAFALTSGLRRLIYGLKSPEHCQIVYGNNIDHYLEQLIRDQPSHILGLGSYSGVDQDKIRIEKIATNQFRNSKIEENAHDRIEINNFLLPIPKVNFKYTNAMGNSWCNLISWKIMRLIKNGTLHSRYSFLHIPKSVDKYIISKQIDDYICNSN